MKKTTSLLLAATLFLLSTKSTYASFFTSTVIPSSYQNYGTPRDIITLQGGDMWYVDSQNSRIVKINANGDILRTVGRAGDADGEFSNSMTSITQDSKGYLYVLDFKKIYKLDFNGGFIKSWGVFGNGVGELANPTGIHYSAHENLLLVSNSINNRITKFDTDGNFVEEFGTGGSGNGQFNEPHGLTTDSSGNIYVVDTNNHRVQVFQEDGTFIRTFGSSDAGDYQLVFPKDVEVMSNGDIVVTSQNSPLIKKFNSSGVYISQWGENGTNTNQFQSPEYLTKSADGSLWVTDWALNRIQKFSNTGSFISVIGNSGQTDGKFTRPSSLDFDTAGNAYVLDSTGRVQKFDGDGNYLSTPIPSGQVGNSAWHVAVSPLTNNIFVSSSYTVSVFNSSGTFLNTIGTHGVWSHLDIDSNPDGKGAGEFNEARGMAFDSNGLLYVADLFNGRVQKFDLSHISDPDFDTTYSGGFLAEWPVMYFVESVFIDSDDNIYVAPPEWNGSSLNVQKYNTSGVLQSVFLDKYGSDPDQYWMINGLFVDSTGKFYLTDPYYNRIQVYENGTLYETIGSGGGDLDQFNEARYARINPVSGELFAIDTGNHRVQILSDGVKIKNLISSADVLNVSSNLSLVKKAINPSSPDASNLGAELYFGDYLVSDFSVDLTTNRDWTNVNAVVIPDQSKSLIVNLNPSDAPGVSTTHSLYIARQQGQSSVVICPLATQISDVTLTCPSGYTLNTGDPNLSAVTIDGVDYWKVTGLTGTGGSSPVVSTYNIDPSSTDVSVGDSISLPVVVKDDEGLIDTNYSGTVHFSSSPQTSTLPADYTFTYSDNGQHTFNSIIFNSPGAYTLTITDTVDSAKTQSVTINVTQTGTSSNTQNNNSQTSTQTSGSDSSCHQKASELRPDLFQVNVIGTTAKLYYTPLSGNVTNYYISYGRKPGLEEYGVFTNQKSASGVLTFSVNKLSSGQRYYFRIKSLNGCASGANSDEIMVIAGSKSSTVISSFYKHLNFTWPLVNAKKSLPSVDISNNMNFIQKTEITPTPTVENKNLTITSQDQSKQSTQSKKICILWWCF